MKEDEIGEYKLEEKKERKGEEGEEIGLWDRSWLYERVKEEVGEGKVREEEGEVGEYVMG